MARRRITRNPGEAWPGYVDVLSTLLLVIVFLLIVFVLAQFFLAETLSGRNAELSKLSQQVSELADLLSLEKKANADLRVNVSQLTASLQQAGSEHDKLVVQLNALNQANTSLSEKASGLASALSQQQQDAASKLAAQSKISTDALAQVTLLNQQILALRQQLDSIAAALKISEAKDVSSQAVIADLGRRLNLALARKVQELAQYRSEFFGRLRKLLGNRSDISIVGDRFVFQSEVLFAQGSATLSPSATDTLNTLAATLLQIAKEIPTDIHWILRVDGNTDATPIHTAQFPSNWELSTARAVAVTKYLISRGVPPDRLAPAGFGQFYPIDPANTPQAYQRNRRIEFKLTER